VTRNRASAKAAGASFESLVANYLAETIDDRIERRRLSGAKDKGDISGLRVHGQRVVIECKNYGGQLLTGPWLTEAETERVNDQALAAFVVAKKRGTTSPGDQIVLMKLHDLTALLNGHRND
jgi:hypothetical protein